jgi:hypothetical protein
MTNREFRRKTVVARAGSLIRSLTRRYAFTYKLL